MQRSIDSFFTKRGQQENGNTSKPTKRKIIISSDEDESSSGGKKTRTDITPKSVEKKITPKSTKRKLIEVDFTSPKKSPKERTLFTRETRTSPRTASNSKNNVKSSLFATNTDKSADRKLFSPAKNDKKNTKTPEKLKVVSKDTEKLPSPAKKEKKNFKTPDKKLSSPAKNKTPVEEVRKDRRSYAALYFQYQNRPSVLNPGGKSIPEGSSNCLSGMSFLVTGVLESLEREKCNLYIQNLGGKVSKTVGKKLNFLIVGEEAGPKKLEDAKNYGIKMINEDELFDMVRKNTKPEDKKPEVKPVKEEVNESFTDKEIDNKIAEESDIKMMVSDNTGVVMPLVEKYKPSSIKEIIGQQGAASNVAKLKTWLSDWFTHHSGKSQTKKAQTWSKGNDGRSYKAALLSGPPGVGKTTTAMLVCKELQFDVVEMNASDTRNKRLLKEHVSELLSNRSLQGYMHGGNTTSKKHVLIMDEVDGMAGNEDRGGMQELIGFIKESSIPIICICNDRNHQKIRSLANYCFDLRFMKPRVEQIKGRILSICFREKMKIAPALIEKVILSTNNDIRQSINQIAFMNSENSDKGSNNKSANCKDVKLGAWDVIRKLFTANDNKAMSFYEKSDLFFHDYSLMPLFVQQNYVQSCPAVESSKQLSRLSAAADSLSMSDQVDKCIRSQSAWSLLPALGALSFVFPGDCMRGYLKGPINFPAWLGKNSRMNKCNRLAQELYDHTRISTSGSRQSVRLDYASHILQKITRPLVKDGVEGVQETLEVLDAYHLLRQDIDSLIELTSWNGMAKSAWEKIDGRVKSALTRAYNKNSKLYSYSAGGNIKAKKVKMFDEYGIENSSESEDGEEEEETIVKDENIKAKTTTKAKKPTKSSQKK